MILSDQDRLIINKYFVGKPIRKAYLFGSLARNEGNVGSDIDILVELDHSSHIGMNFFVYQAELEDLMNRKVDLVSDEGFRNI